MKHSAKIGNSEMEKLIEIWENSIKFSFEKLRSSALLGWSYFDSYFKEP